MLHLPLALTVAVIGVAGAIVGATINNLLAEVSKNRDRKLAERGRLFDLYRVVYPEKVKAFVDLHERAARVYMAIWPIYKASTERRAELMPQFEIDLDSLYVQAKASEALLGPEVVHAVEEFRNVCIRWYIVEDTENSGRALQGGAWAHDPSYKTLTETLRHSVHLDALGATLGIDVVKSNREHARTTA